MLKPLLIAALALLHFAPVSAQTPQRKQQAASSAAPAPRMLDFAGETRRYRLAGPTTPATTPRPVVIYLHGGGLDGGRSWQHSAWPELAQREGFLLVVPDAVDGHWNDGRNSSFRPGKPPRLQDDVGFLAALIDKMVREHGADRSRIFMTGPSNGGNMIYRYVCERGQDVRAIAPMIASLQQKIADTCRLPQNLPVLMIAGTADPLVPWAGGTTSKASAQRGNSFEPRLSIPETLAFWALANGCGQSPVERALPDRNPADGSTVTQVRYTSCRNNVQTLLYRINGGGHQTPRLDATFANPRLIERFLGKQNHDIDGDALAWAFFQRNGVE